MRPDEVAHHTEVQNLVKGPRQNSRCSSDRHKGIYLTKGDLKLRLEKSAEVIVAGGTSRDCEHHTPEDSQNSEGPNVKFVLNAARRSTD